ncbi:MAG: NUDIX hydrolase [Alphaproteobacteria bacterium]|jgi:ADP-ribose pyrophosphatase YjhB (NUDIX family)|nr:NUDIX hydrolase [Rhodospirillaceae bacterium]MDP6407030.1 NUDIX hydrolase [Alphaproteobacteria bacterium]MDP6620938.1 NUDIX hydrolase [Alphaproteobacteria bacterium]|tara:strand:- start:44 stop:625 length:582 start_codon:yes stop_codon:yes gene_type:complete
MNDKRPRHYQWPPLPENFSEQVPDGDNLERLVCDTCGFINYINPKIVVGAVVAWQGRLLMCRRDIEPRRGYWTMPAGFLEERETIRQGAEREAREEAEAEIDVGSLLAIYEIPRISQVQMIFRATLLSDDVGAGIETQEVAFFDFDDMPWDDLAFPTVTWALRDYQKVEGLDDFAPFSIPDTKLGRRILSGEL